MKSNENLETPPYQRIVQKIQALYNNSISDAEAHEAARNLIGLCKILLEIHADLNQNLTDEQ